MSNSGQLPPRNRDTHVWRCFTDEATVWYIQAGTYKERERALGTAYTPVVADVHEKCSLVEVVYVSVVGAITSR